MRQVVYEQYWPWQVLAELDLDLTQGFRDPSQALNEEIAHLLNLGYRPSVAVQDDIASCYTTITYTFCIKPQDHLLLLLRFPQSRTTHPV
jgi:hypothetical protein